MFVIDSRKLKAILRSAENLNDEIMIEMTSSEWKIVLMDNAHIALLVVRCDVSEFLEYPTTINPPKEIKICSNKAFIAFLKQLGDELVRITFENEASPEGAMIISTEDREANIMFRLPFASFEECQINTSALEAMEYWESVEISAELFWSIVSLREAEAEFHLQHNTLDVAVGEQKFFIMTQHDVSSEFTIRFSMPMLKNLMTIYNELLSKKTRAYKAQKIIVFLKNESPLKVLIRPTGLAMNATYYIAPRVSDEDNEDDEEDVATPIKKALPTRWFGYLRSDIVYYIEQARGLVKTDLDQLLSEISVQQSSRSRLEVQVREINYTFSNAWSASEMLLNLADNKRSLLAQMSPISEKLLQLEYQKNALLQEYKGLTDDLEYFIDQFQ